MEITKRVVPLLLISTGLLFSQTPDASLNDLPALVTFVAPAYPRAARYQRIMGKTITRITVDRDGVVTYAQTISAHRIFESYVLAALKQWRFRPSEQEHTFQVKCSFALDDECEGTSGITSETRVSAKLPAFVQIKTGWQCPTGSGGRVRE